MTQAAVNSAKVLYRLSVSREDVEKAEKLFFMTPQLQKVLTSPVVPAAKKYEIIDQVFALETDRRCAGPVHEDHVQDW